ncbi:hypothetical protein ACRAWD_28475 [Caulobacter segnis]
MATSRSIHREPDRGVLAVTPAAPSATGRSRPTGVVAQALARFGRRRTPWSTTCRDQLLAEPLYHLHGRRLRGQGLDQPGRLLPHHPARRGPGRCGKGAGHIVGIATSLTDHANADVPSVLASLTKAGGIWFGDPVAAHRAGQPRACGRARRLAGRDPHAECAPETHAFLAGLHPVNRLGEIRDVVDAVLYLEGWLRDGRDPARRRRPERRSLAPSREENRHADGQYPGHSRGSAPAGAPSPPTRRPG